MTFFSAATSEADAVPAQHFAIPPYKPFPARDDMPEGWHGVANATGLNVLTFKSAPGAVFTSKAGAHEIADRWNKERT